LAEEFREEVVFVGVSNNDTLADGKDFQAEFGVPYELAHAPEVWDLFGVPYQPVTIVLGPTGEQVERIEGPIDYEDLQGILAGVTS
jgi:hypothetical protein